jgi:hypothetical protein
VEFGVELAMCSRLIGGETVDDCVTLSVRLLLNILIG